MKLLLDQGLPRRAASILAEAGIDAVHVGEVGLAHAADTEIIEAAGRQSRTIVTLDADFHGILARTRALGPSVVRIRIEGLRAEPLAAIIRSVLNSCGDELANGAAVSVTERSIRVRRLPLP